MSPATLCVIGGGVVGLGLAGELSPHYDRVVVLERDEYCFREASYASGGMLAPFMEVDYKEEDVLRFNKRNLEVYPSFVQRLREESGVPISVFSQGSLHLAFDETQQAELDRLFEYQKRLDLPVERLSPGEVRNREPLVDRNVRAGLFAPAEKHVNNRQLGLALLRRCRNRDVQLLTDEPVEGVKYNPRGSSVTRIQTPRTTVAPDEVILAAGAWTGRIPGLKSADRMPIRPVKGQALAVRLGGEFQPDSIIRTPDFYGVPHVPERFIVGATMEERGFDSTPESGAVLDLLDAVHRALPDVRDRELLEHWSGFRPATRDSRPVIGPSSATGNLYFAAGHYRNGILQLPLTLRAIEAEVVHNESPDWIEPFSPDRFQRDDQPMRAHSS